MCVVCLSVLQVEALNCPHTSNNVLYHPTALTFITLQTTTGGNRTMVAAAIIVSMAAADVEHVSIFALVCPNKALTKPAVSHFLPQIYSLSKEEAL